MITDSDIILSAAQITEGEQMSVTGIYSMSLILTFKIAAVSPHISQSQ